MKAMILFLRNRYFYKLFTEIMIPIVKKKTQQIMTCVNLFLNYLIMYNVNLQRE